MWNYFIKGGFLMWPLLGYSIFSVAIIIERFMFFHRVGRVDEEVVQKIRLYTQKNDVASALKLCEKYKTPVTNMLKKAVLEYKDGKETMEKVIEEASLYEIPRLEKHLPMLSTIASISTLTGFTGTVIGMINAFNSIAASGASSPTVVAKGISQALITTATGLLIAVPTLLFYHYFTYRVDRIVNQLERAARGMTNL